MSSSSQRRTRRTIETSYSHMPKKTLKKDRMDSSCYRLSKTAPLGVKKGKATETTELYSTKYFREHPEEADDTRSPVDKLKEIDQELDSDLDDEEKFNLLMKQKALRYMAFGDTSVEALYSHTSLGEYYNFNDMPESAIRHFNKAKNLQKNNEVEEEVKARIAIGTAEAHLILSENSRKEISQAATAIKPVLNTTIQDPHLRFRRDICNARILFSKEKEEESFEEYKKAEETLKEIAPEEDEGIASLYVEMGEPGRLCGKENEAVPFYKKAYDIYKSLEMEEEAKEIEPYTHEVETQSIDEEQANTERKQTDNERRENNKSPGRKVEFANANESPESTPRKSNLQLGISSTIKDKI